jgi:hypothetical protein
VIVALTQRPRPEYIYGLTLVLMTATGFSIAVLLARARATAVLASTAVVAAIGILLAFPPYFRPGPRPIFEGVHRLEPFRSMLQRRGDVLVTTGYGLELCAYLGRTPDDLCSSPSWATLRDRIKSGVSVADALDQTNATVIYADPGLQAAPVLSSFLAAPERAGWRQAARGTGIDGVWSVLVRR